MAIVSIPAGMAEVRVECTICRAVIPFSDATAGLHDVDNRQTFACNYHFRSGQQFIVGWADFIIAERRRHLERGECIDVTEREGVHLGWAVC